MINNKSIKGVSSVKVCFSTEPSDYVKFEDDVVYTYDIYEYGDIICIKTFFNSSLTRETYISVKKIVYIEVSF